MSAADRLAQKAAERVRAKEGAAKPSPVRRLIAKAAARVEASPEERLERLLICNDCPHYVDGRLPRCGACGCPIAARTRFKWIPLHGDVHCPKGKW